MGRRLDASAGAASTSPWPILVALGLATSELGVFVGSVPVAVAGLVLFGGSAAGLAHEAGYVSSRSDSLFLAGGLLVAVGGVTLVLGASAATVPAVIAEASRDGVARRGLVILVAGGLLSTFAVVGRATSILEPRAGGRGGTEDRTLEER